jgi:predicted GNAT superfamily acetyltransferase
MGAGAFGADPLSMGEQLVIRPARREDLPAAAELLRVSLGFDPPDAIPAWLMATAQRTGGVVLVAVDAATVIGLSYAFPAWDGRRPYLFSCGLAIEPARRGRGIGHALKREQRRRARAAGYEAIRWTADPLNTPALRLYLSGLGARVTAYHAALHDGLRAGGEIPQDDVDVDWPLSARDAAHPAAVEYVDLPPNASTDRLAARLRVRADMRPLLADGFQGTAVEIDPASGRARMRFER